VRKGSQALGGVGDYTAPPTKVKGRRRGSQNPSQKIKGKKETITNIALNGIP
jgi:hypothetical protein